MIKYTEALIEEKSNRHSPFAFSVDKLLDGVAKHVLQGPAEGQAGLLVHVKGQQAGQQHWN